MSRLHKSSPTTMEGTVLTLPAFLGWNTQIGDLWNCRTSKQVGGNIFEKFQIEKEDYLEVVPVHDMKYTLSRVGNSSGKAELLDISVEVKLEFPTFSVEGGVSFKKEDTKSFEQEEFFCQYNVQTCLLRTRASIFDPLNADIIIDSAMKDRISDGKTATHYVSEVRYGGWATGQFQLTDTMNHNLLDLSGTVGGTIPVFAGISVGLKASISFLEKDTKKNFSKKIKIQAQPSIGFTPPTTITDMFAIVEKIPGAIDKQAQPYPADGSIKGIPISFKLSPLSHLIRMEDGYETYDLLAAEILAELQEMIFNLHDFQESDNHHYRGLLREQDPRLVIMFPQPKDYGPLNPWAAEVDDYQKMLSAQATTLGDAATTTLQKYKKKSATLDEVKAVIARYNGSPLYPATLKEQLLRHVASGKSILNVLRLADASIAGEPEIFIFTPDRWWDILNNHSGLKLFLSTAGTEVSGTFYKFFNLVQPLRQIGFGDIRIAAPNIVQEFSLLLKIGYNYPIAYRGKDITKALDLLGIITAGKGRVNTNSSKFYSIYSTATGGDSVDNYNVAEFPSIFTNFVGNFDQMGLICGDNYLQTLQALRSPPEQEEESQTDPDFIFLLPIQFLTSAYDGVFYYKEFISKLKDAKIAISFRTVVGCFDNYSGDGGEGPLMFVLDRNGAIVAVCFDQLDFLLLMHQLTQNNNGSSLDMISPKVMGTFSLSPFKLDTALELSNILDHEKTLPPSPITSRPNPFILLGDEDPFLSPKFRDASKILDALAFSPIRVFVAVICSKVAKLYTGKMVALLQKHKWSEQQGFSEEPSWSGLGEELANFVLELGAGSGRSRRDEPEIPEPIKYLEILQTAVDFAAGGSRLLLRNVCEFYLNTFFESFTTHKDGPLHEAITKIWNEFGEATKDKYLEPVLKSIRLLQFARLNPNYYLLWRSIDPLWIQDRADEPRGLLIVLDVLEGLTLQEQQWVWGNPKFQYWSSLFFNSKSVMAKIYKIFCKEGVPTWLPAEHRRHLLVLEGMLEDPVVKWRQRWQSVPEMVTTFGRLIVKQCVPIDFTPILFQNLIDNPELITALREAGVLFYWDETESHFSSGWGMAEIVAVFHKLRENNANKKQIMKSIEGSTKIAPKMAQALKQWKNPTKYELITLNSQWRMFTGQDGTLRKISIQDFHKFANPINLAPSSLLEPGQLESTVAKVPPYLWGQVRQGSLSSSALSSILQYFDYVFLPRDEEQLLNSSSIPTIEANTEKEGSTMSFLPPLHMIFSPSLSCFGGMLPSTIGRSCHDYSSVARDDKDEMVFESNSFLLSRSDLLTLLLTGADDGAKLQIFSQLSAVGSHSLQYLKAFPWFIPDITKEALESVDLTKYLNSVDISQYYEPTMTLERRLGLFAPPYKLITALRVGSFDNSHYGKSTILNEVLLQSCHFSYKFEPGYQNGSPISRPGLVELAFLSQSTASSSFYKKVLKSYLACHEREFVLLANVHGDGLQMPEELMASLKSASGAFLIFWGCGNWKEMRALKPDLDSLLGGFGKNGEGRVANFVLDPDLSIRKNVDASIIIDTRKENGEFREKVEKMMGNILNGMDPTVVAVNNPGPAEELIEFIQKHSLVSIRRCLSLQNNDLSAPAESNPLRDELLLLFMNIITIENVTQRDTELQYFNHELNQMSQKARNGALAKIQKLTTRFPAINPDDKVELRQITASLRAARHELDLTSLSSLNLFRELCLIEQGNPNYYEILSSVFLSSFPLELFNLNFHPTFDSSISACFAKLEDLNLKFLTISVLGPQGSHKSTLLNELFSPAFSVGPFGSTDGVLMRLIHLDAENKPEALGDIDALLVLDCEGYSRTGNVLDASAAIRERQLGALVLSLSSLCLITLAGDSETDWFSKFRGILELFFFAECSLQEEPTSPDTIILNSMTTEELSSNQISVEVREMLKTVNNLTATDPIRTRAKYSTISRLKPLYARTLGSSLVHEVTSDDYHNSLQSLRNKIITSCSSMQPLSGDVWFARATQIWQLISDHGSLFENDNCAKIQANLDLESVVSGIIRAYESCYAAHEDLLEDGQSEDGEDEFIALSGIPFFCRNENPDDCSCQEQIPLLEGFEQSLRAATKFPAPSPSKMSLIFETLDNYTIQLRAEIVARMLQERYASEIIQGTEDGVLHTELKRILEQGHSHDENWVSFKTYLSTLLTVGPWVGTIHSEIEIEYGVEVLEEIKGLEDDLPPGFQELDVFGLDHFGIWGLSPLDMTPRTEALKGFLNWEEYVWLEMEIETIIKHASFAGNGYKRGMLRVVREEVDKVLGGRFKSMLPSELEYRPTFINEVHFLAVVSYVKYWELEWEKWVKNWDPLLLLEERKDKFPDELFLGEEEG